MGKFDRPDYINMTAERRALLDSFAPDEEALFLRVRDKVSPQMLKNISMADCASPSEKHLPALLVLHDNRGFDQRMTFFPHEVLRFRSDCSDRTDTDYERVFSAVALLRAYGHPDNYIHMDYMNKQLFILIESLDELAIDLVPETLSFLAWLIGELSSTDNDSAFFLLASCYLALKPSLRKVQRRRPDDQAILTLVLWIIDTEQLIYDGEYTWNKSDVPGASRWLMRTGNLPYIRWTSLSAKMMALLKTIKDQETRDNLELIALELAGPNA